MRAVFTAYMDGQGINEVMSSTGASRGSVSGHLNEIEAAIGVSIVRGKRVAPKTDTLQAERETGQRKASVRDFHSFRVTWITLALAAGVPLELVQRVTGHRTVEVLMKHYFRPGREDFRQAIMRAMPKMLAEPPQKPVKDQVLAILEGMTAKTWRRDQAQLIHILSGLRSASPSAVSYLATVKRADAGYPSTVQNVSVDHRGCDVLVAHYFLNRTDIGT